MAEQVTINSNQLAVNEVFSKLKLESIVCPVGAYLVHFFLNV